jgi:hypothetical protein
LALAGCQDLLFKVDLLVDRKRVQAITRDAQVPLGWHAGRVVEIKK